MKKYNVFNLCVVNFENYFFICEKLCDEGMYREIFTGDRIKVLDDEKVEPLKNYYSLLAVMSYTTGKPLMLTKKDLLKKYAEINSYYIELRKQHNSYYEDVIKEQEQYIKALKELNDKNPEKAKEVALDNLRRIGIINQNDEMVESDKILTRKKD